MSPNQLSNPLFALSTSCIVPHSEPGKCIEVNVLPFRPVSEIEHDPEIHLRAAQEKRERKLKAKQQKTN